MYNQIIYSILSQSTDITDIVSGGASDPAIYPVIGTQTATFPLITYTKEIIPTNTKGAQTVQDMVHIYFLAVANDGDTADTLSRAIRSTLDNSTYDTADVHIPVIQLVKQDEEMYFDNEGVDIIAIRQHYTMKANHK